MGKLIDLLIGLVLIVIFTKVMLGGGKKKK